MNRLIVFSAIILLLWIGRSIFIPLLVAAFLWYLINAVSDYFRRIFPFCSPKNRRERIWDLVFNATASGLSRALLCGTIYMLATQRFRKN